MMAIWVVLPSSVLIVSLVFAESCCFSPADPLADPLKAGKLQKRKSPPFHSGKRMKRKA